MSHLLFPSRQSRRLLIAFAITLAGVMPNQLAHAASITVNGNGDVVSFDGFCTLREAILNANGNNQSGSTDCVAGVGADTIGFSLGLSTTITLNGTQLPAISGPLTIDGSSAVSLTLNANNASGVFLINPGSQVTLTAMTIENGNATNGAIQNGGSLRLSNARLFNNTGQVGGGIYNIGSLAVVNSTIISNTGVTGGGGIYNTSGSVELVNSSLLNNRTTNAAIDGGGGLYSRGNSASTASVSIQNSTIASNTSALRGGGLFNDVASQMEIRNSTISGNSAVDGAGLYNSSFISGLNVGYATIANNTATAGTGGVQLQAGSTSSFIGTIIAGNTGTASADCGGEAITSLGYNLIGSTTGCSITGTTGTNVTGVNALLGPLANNGGSTLTHLPQAGSPALNAIPFGLAVCNFTSSDQLGTLRPQGPACDIGAVEAGFTGPSLIVTKTADRTVIRPNGAFTYTIVVRNNGSVNVMSALISDTLPLSISVAGPVTFQPLSTDAPNTLIFGTDIAAGSAATVTIPVRIDSSVHAARVFTNTVVVSSPSISAPVSATAVISVAGELYLPMIFRDTATQTLMTTVQIVR